MKHDSAHPYVLNGATVKRQADARQVDLKRIGRLLASKCTISSRSTL
jgi:hypothetical protein